MITCFYYWPNTIYHGIFCVIISSPHGTCCPSYKYVLGRVFMSGLVDTVQFNPGYYEVQKYYVLLFSFLIFSFYAKQHIYMCCSITIKSFFLNYVVISRNFVSQMNNSFHSKGRRTLMTNDWNSAIDMPFINNMILVLVSQKMRETQLE